MGAGGFRGLGFAAHEGASALAAAMTEFGARPSVARIDRAARGEIYRISGAEALAAGLATVLAPK